ncbi:hypothetical protein NUU61_006317 [Penicillium alfredii]|uniref:Uncharacterized protein n=1 Tax=Penicillium alfredii TaxID=1506179 RepID=A0A9W9F0N3_9EURO|nr:uncharacterized protein NUU61_006317 [Penicillium alfredii]KAJ5091447.1 hypothetical protein NUU61_006317 [Penicillium alfredii]
MNNASKFSLYVFLIILGCVVFVLLGFGIWTMYHGIEDDNYRDISYEQRKYMREVRQRMLNRMAVEARRPDMIVPIEELNY